MNIPFDLHTHCDLSFDGESTAEEMTARASGLGMKYYALTDHVEINVFSDEEYRCNLTVERAKEQLPRIKENYSDKLTFLYGVEIGQPVHDRTLSEKILSENSYDFVIGSCHMIRGYDDFYFLDYTLIENDPVKLLDIYFAELLETAEWNGFDVLGHITYPLRYIVGDYGIDVNMSRYDGIIDRILTTVIRNGKGIEINTSGLRQKIGRFLPDEELVTRYRQLGGTIITIGSDAHKTADLGKGIPEGILAAKRAGFDKIAVFIGRKPLFVDI